MTEKSLTVETALKLLSFLLPLLCLIIGGYFACEHLFFKQNFNKTIEDLEQITGNMSEKFNGRYPALNSTLLVVNDILPYDLEVTENAMGYDFSNRFGGKIFFYDAYNTSTEKNNFTNSSYVGAYIVLLTRLTANECKKLSQTDWRRKFPNFLGLEASYLSAQKSFNGVFNLQNYLLFDKFEVNSNSRDEGTISRRYLTKNESEKACACLLSTCTIALKFQ